MRPRGQPQRSESTQPLQLALAKLLKGRLGEAEALCAGILRRDPRRADALHVSGLIALQGGQVTRAIELIRRSLTLDPQQPVAHMNLANALLRAGKAQAALLSSDAALAQRPNYAEAFNARANALLELRRPMDALNDYERALQLRPDLAVIHNNYGNALRDLQRPAAALASYRRALELQPGLRESLIGSAQVLRALQRPQEALESCEASLKRNADDVEALHLRALLRQDSRRYLEALDDLDHALRLQPEADAIALDRGNTLCQLQRYEEALAAYQRMLDRRPGDAEVLFNRGNVLLILQRHDEALLSYEAAIKLDPSCAKAHCYRGNTLRLLRRPEAALRSYERAIALDSGSVPALNGMGHVLSELERLPEALSSYEQALCIDPNSLEGLSNRSRVLLMSGRSEEAVQCLERLLEVAPEAGPEYNHSLGVLLHARLLACDWRHYDSTTAAIEAGVGSGKRVTGPSLYTASGLSPELHLRCARGFVDEMWGSVSAPKKPASRTRHDTRDERIRLAYVSGDFRDHPVSQLMAGIFERHDRERFETTAISLRAPNASAMAQRVRGAFDRFIDVTRLRDAEVAALLRELEIDVCIDLTGYTAHFRSGIFARRAAPVQVNYLGYPGTMAAPFMDYIIADPVVIPPAARDCYAESVVYLPHSYLPPGDRRALSDSTPTRLECGLPERGFVFCAFNNHAKIVPPVFDIWMRLLQAVKDSVLWLTTGTDTILRNLAREARARGVDAERIVFAPRLASLEDHLARQRLADLFLDTLPYNAHTTASDALWAGLPVLTCAGRTFPGRVAASLLSALGVPELVAQDLADYESRALDLSRSPELLAPLRARLTRNRDAHPLFDSEKFCRQLEAAYTLMWQRYQRGEEPASFRVPPTA